LLAAAAALFLRGRSTAKGIATPKPMIRLAQLTLATILFVWLIGKLRAGGEPSMALWQIDRVMYLPSVFLLCQAAFRGPRDYLAVGKVILAAATLRALQAIYVRAIVPAEIDPQTGESSLAYATTHHDSMLFGLGAVVLVALVLQRVGKGATRLTLVLMPVLVGGMIANDRRMVWVQIILVFAALYLMTETNATKRKLQRALKFLGPVGAIYVVAGWSSKAALFKPVQIIRSAVDSDSDASTAWRDVENFDLIYTIRQFPIFGTGWGHGFWEVWPLPPIDYSLERYIPHNSILGLWCYGGFLGYTGLTLLWVGGVYFGVRAYHHCTKPLEKAAALASFASVLIYYVQCFGDMGLGSWTGVFTVGPAMAVACKLAVSSGAWPIAARASKATGSRASGVGFRSRTS